MNIREKIDSEWAETLEFNKQFNLDHEKYTDDVVRDLEFVKVPFFPLRLNPYIFSRFNSIFSTLINGGNGNSIEIIYNEVNQEILDIKLIKTDNDGNILEFIHNPLPKLDMKYSMINDSENLFRILKKEILALHFTEIGFVKIIDSIYLESILDLLEKEKEKKENDHLICLFERAQIFFNFLKKKKIRFYPDQTFFTFFEKFMATYGNPQNFFSIIKSYFINGKLSVTLKNENWYNTFISDEETAGEIFNISAKTPFDLGSIDIEDLYKWEKLLKKIHDKYNTDHNIKLNYLLDLDWISELLNDIIESEIPFNENRIKFIFQKLLFGIKSIELTWDVYPKPLVYNDAIRFFLRILGFHINPRKISYWSLPDLVSFFFKNNFGSNYKMLVLIKDEMNTNSGGSSSDRNEESGKIEKIKGFIINISDSKLYKINTIDMEEIKQIQDLLILDSEKTVDDDLVEHDQIKEISNFKNRWKEITTFKSNIHEIHKKFSSKYGFLTEIIYIDNKLLKELFQFFLFDANSKNPFKMFKFIRILNRLKKTEFFYCFPEFPFFKYFKKMGSIRLIRQISPILFDLKEF